jgi:two-component system, NarL family, response regulator LiaR
MERITVGITDDNENLRNGVVKMIDREPDIRVILEAENGLDLLNKLRMTKPDVLLLDIRMPQMNGVETTQALMKQYPDTKIITFTSYIQPQLILDMFRMGVKSFISKESHIQDLLKAIRLVHSGGSYMTEYAGRTIRQFLNSNGVVPTIELSAKEKSLLKMLIEGLNSKEIGLKLFKSPRTIEDMREKLYQKFNVKNKEQLIALASRWDLTNDVSDVMHH